MRHLDENSTSNLHIKCFSSVKKKRRREAMKENCEDSSVNYSDENNCNG